MSKFTRHHAKSPTFGGWERMMLISNPAVEQRKAEISALGRCSFVASAIMADENVDHTATRYVPSLPLPVIHHQTRTL